VCSFNASSNTTRLFRISFLCCWFFFPLLLRFSGQFHTTFTLPEEPCKVRLISLVLLEPLSKSSPPDQKRTFLPSRPMDVLRVYGTTVTGSSFQIFTTNTFPIGPLPLLQSLSLVCFHSSVNSPDFFSSLLAFVFLPLGGRVFSKTRFPSISCFFFLPVP